MGTEVSQEPLVGRVGDLTPADVISALSTIQEGRIISLDCGRFMGMPQSPVHPKYQLLTYRTPRGFELEDDLFGDADEVGMSFVTEMMISSLHIGTHLDALGHAGCGDEWYGGFQPSKEVGDHGLLRADASSIPPFITPGVMLDAAAHAGVEYLPPSTGLGRSELQAIAEAQGVSIPQKGTVFVRTGAMTKWDDTPKFDEISTAGPDLDAAQWLVEDFGTVVLGGDTATIEPMPSTVPGHPSPVHEYLLAKQGVHLLELAWMEELARERIYEFCLICLPIKVNGATASMVRPIAVI